MGVLSPLLYPGYKEWDGVLRVICSLDEACILGGGKSKANTSSLRGRRGDRLYCSINSYNIGEGRIARVWFFHSCIPRPFHPWIATFPRIRVFSNESALLIRWPKYRNLSFSISPSNEYSGLISFRTDWFDLLSVQGTLKSPSAPQLESINSLVLSLLYGPTLTSIHDYWKNHSLD